MKLILDEDLPLRTAAALRRAGVEAMHVLELGMQGSLDQAVLERARQDGAVVVTKDADFHQLLATAGANQPSVIRIRDEDIPWDQVASILVDVLARTEAALQMGAAVSAAGGRVRVRRLPIGR